MELVLISGLILGITTSLHCLGMCGPIALSLGVSANNPVKFHTQNVIYQLGRITTYSFFGLIVGLLGKSINFLGFQDVISIVSGSLIILLVLVPSLAKKTMKNTWFEKYMFLVKNSISKYIRKPSYLSKYITGIANGFLPCGPVYVAIAGAIAANGIFNSIAFMFFFGLGTLPLMYITVFLGRKIQLNFRNRLFKAFPYITILIGALFIIRGLHLGIPMLSPSKAMLEMHTKHTTETNDTHKCH